MLAQYDQARTAPAVHVLIAASRESARVLAGHYGVTTAMIFN